jgi:IS4 transposase
MNQGQSVLAQLLDLLPRRAFDHAVRRYRGERRVRTLSCRDQLLAMIFAQITGRASLRETVLCLRALGPRRYHCGFRTAPARSTLADANQTRDYRIFEETALALIAIAVAELPRAAGLRRLHARLYALDSTTIDLCLALFPWAYFRRRKAALKAHVLFDVGVGVPVFVRISHGKTHDLWMLDQLAPQPGAFYMMDKGYLDFARLYRMHQAGAFFVTRAKRNLDCTVRERRPVRAGGAVTSDCLVRLRGPKSRRLYPDTLRLIRYVDPQTGRRLRFLTNHLTLDARTVALLYRQRWRIELFFKWLKQHLHIKAFFGVTPNAVKTQVWIALLVYVLVVRLKHRHQLPQERNEIFQVLSVTLSEKVPVFELFSQKDPPLSESHDRNQLSLFN